MKSHTSSPGISPPTGGQVAAQPARAIKAVMSALTAGPVAGALAAFLAAAVAGTLTVGRDEGVRSCPAQAE